MKINKKQKRIIFLLLTVVGMVIACSSIIANDYLKTAVVLITLCPGIFGLLKSIGSSAPKANADEDKPAADKK
ncbi:MAG: hypothetical protein LBT42_06210 [Tannerella sp.]|jgi:hypothetical protein|nr:hypothetical protein [Tannerella sp.]